MPVQILVNHYGSSRCLYGKPKKIAEQNKKVKILEENKFELLPYCICPCCPVSTNSHMNSRNAPAQIHSISKLFCMWIESQDGLELKSKFFQKVNLWLRIATDNFEIRGCSNLPRESSLCEGCLSYLRYAQCLKHDMTS